MRALLMSILLIITVVVLYLQLAEGDGGTKAQLAGSGSKMAERIRGMDP